MKKIGYWFSGFSGFSGTAGPPQKFDHEDLSFNPVHNPNDTDDFCSPFWQDALAEWVSGLPVNVRPLELVARYPRVAAKIMTNWREQAALQSCFESLLFDQRKDRQGFPKTIGAELIRLQIFACKRARTEQTCASKRVLPSPGSLSEIWPNERKMESGFGQEFQPLL